MRHPQHAAFVSALQRWSIAEGIKYKTKLAEKLGFPNRRIQLWLCKGVMPKRENLKTLATITGSSEFLNLRDAP